MSDQQVDPAIPGDTPDQGPPPRQVQPWTRVQGHVVTRGSSVSICSCNSWRSDRRPEPLEEHIRDAWPVLMPREDGDVDIEAWAARVELAQRQAVEHLEELSVRFGIDQPTRPGEEIPVLTPEYIDAGSRVEVLEHQLEDLRERIVRSRRGY